MATKIVTKNSSTASAVPTASDLVQGELAVNVADKRLFTENNAGAVVELGTNPSGNVTFQDNGKAIFGAGSDLQIYHDGSHSYIADVGAGDLILQAGNDLVLRQPDGSTEYLRANEGAGVQIYHNGSQKFLTTATGIDVTGTATMDGLSVQTTNGLNALLESSNSYQYLQFKNTDETNNYIGFVSDDFVVSPANNQKLIVTAEGSVGIGTSSPDTKLHLVDSTPEISLTRTSDFYYGRLSADGFSAFSNTNSNAPIIFKTATNERMRISSAGHTMFATTDDAPGAGNTQSGVAIRGGSDNRSFFSASSNYVAAFNRNTNDGPIVEFNKNGTGVGSIGTASNDLNIDGGTSHSGIRFQAGSLLPRLNGADTDGTIDLGYNDGTATHRWRDLYLSGATKLFSGTNSPAANSTLGDVDFGARTDGTVTARVRGIAGSNGNGTDGQLTFYTASNTASQAAQERMRIDSAGNLLVGTTTAGTPSQGIGLIGGITDSLIRVGHAAGTGSGSLYMQFSYNQSQVGSISQNGTSQVLYNISSDQRLKENIVDAPSASDDIDAIQVRSFNWKADGVHQKYGMIAQELQAVAPDAVSGDADSEEMMGVDYSKLVPMLVKEIQSLRNRVAQLEE